MGSHDVLQVLGRSGRVNVARGITTTSNDAVDSLKKPYTWLHSYVAGDKIYCFHQAENAEVIREHAKTGGFPANLVVEVASVFDSTGPRDLPR